jgi:hypothetical protein
MSTTPLSDADSGLAAFAVSLELAARDLYQAVIDAGGESTAWRLLRNQHAAYAENMSGIAGMSANARDEELYTQRSADFGGDRPANAAFDLENTLAATHVELLVGLTDVSLIESVASIAMMESRHAAYLGQQSGRGDDYAALFVNSATAVVPEAAS